MRSDFSATDLNRGTTVLFSSSTLQFTSPTLNGQTLARVKSPCKMTFSGTTMSTTMPYLIDSASYIHSFVLDATYTLSTTGSDVTLSIDNSAIPAPTSDFTFIDASFTILGYLGLTSASPNFVFNFSGEVNAKATAWVGYPYCGFGIAGSTSLITSLRMKTACSTTLGQGISAQIGYPITGVGDMAAIVMQASVSYDNLSIDLDTFGMLSVLVDCYNPQMDVSKSSIWGANLEIKGTPPPTIRIMWPSEQGAIPPQNGVKYKLLETIGSFPFQPRLAVKIEYTDVYDFKLTYVADSGHTIVYYEHELYDASPSAPPDSILAPSPTTFIPNRAPSQPTPAPSVACPPPPPGFICSSNGTWISNSSVYIHGPFFIPSVTVFVETFPLVVRSHSSETATH